MMSTYQIVWFVSDPFLGTRHPVGALVHADETTWVRAQRLPCPRCIGSAWVACLDSILATIDADPSPDRVAAMGPAITLGPMAMAMDADTTSEWLIKFVLPN
jgi:hypothetical protein